MRRISRPHCWKGLGHLRRASGCSVGRRSGDRRKAVKSALELQGSCLQVGCPGQLVRVKVSSFQPSCLGAEDTVIGGCHKQSEFSPVWLAARWHPGLLLAASSQAGVLHRQLLTGLSCFYLGSGYCLFVQSVPCKSLGVGRKISPPLKANKLASLFII